MSSSQHHVPSASATGATQDNHPATHTQPTTEHSSASGTQPSTSNNEGASLPPPAGQEELPPQLHAGKVGYGPNYHVGPTLEDKIMGLKEEIKGKLTHNPERVQHGKEIKSGEERRKKVTGEDEPNPFQKADEEKAKQEGKTSTGSTQDATKKADDELQLGKSNTNASTTGTGTGDLPNVKSTHGGGLQPEHGTGPNPRVQAATVAPEGTHDAQRQKMEGGEGQMKHFGYDAVADVAKTENPGAMKHAPGAGLEPGQERERRSNPMMKN